MVARGVALCERTDQASQVNAFVIRSIGTDYHAPCAAREADGFADGGGHPASPQPPTRQPKSIKKKGRADMPCARFTDRPAPTGNKHEGRP